jgi:transposase, IS30 family
MPCPFVHLSLEERRQLARLKKSKLSVTEIAQVLGRHRSTIYREIRRNWWHAAQVLGLENTGRGLPSGDPGQSRAAR